MQETRDFNTSKVSASSSEDKRPSRQLMGKTIVTKSGKKFGEVGNLVFETRTGELIHLLLRNATPYAEGLDLEKDSTGNQVIPFSAVIAVGDFVVVEEEDIL